MTEHTARSLPADLAQARRVLVAGAGVSGRGCARVLDRLNFAVTIADDNPQARQTALDDCGARAAGLSTEQAMAVAGDGQIDLVVTSPGWRPNSPLLEAYRAAGVEVIGDVELAYRLDAAGTFGPARQWLVITGTNGKTTTTGMLAAIMQADTNRTGRRAVPVGNIGVSVFDAIQDNDRVDVLVAELSSFQLHWASQLRPEVGVLLNLAEDHLDWHGSFDNYAADKAKVMHGGIAIAGADDAHVMELVSRARQAGDLAPQVYSFSSQTPQAGQVGVEGGRIIARLDGEDLDLVSADGVEPAGLAGVLDACAAAAAGLAAGASREAVQAGLAAYHVAGHRGAVVHRHGGVSFIDNSKATNPHAADAALEGLDRVIWLAGGQLKGADVSELVATHADQLKAAVVLGKDRELVAQALQAHAPQVPVTVLDEQDPQAAMAAAVAAAWQHAEAGDTVLLAPAAASLDMYTGMAQRGDFFAAAARAVTDKSDHRSASDAGEDNEEKPAQ